MRAKLVFISSDSVFEGTRGNYKEDDNKNPINYYAKTKDIAEEIIKSSCEDYLIIRTNIFGFHQSEGKSLVEWALNMLTKGQKINGFVDVKFNAIYTRFLSRIILNMIELDLNGTYHVCSNNSLSKFEFLIKLANIFKLNVELISPMKASELSLQTKRPNDTTLNIEKIQTLVALPSIEDGLLELYTDYLNFFKK
jgi:dTDP-4-dehydrorhamnose reductase